MDFKTRFEIHEDVYVPFGSEMVKANIVAIVITINADEKTITYEVVLTEQGDNVQYLEHDVVVLDSLDTRTN